jgi:hypothetical protein
VILLAVVMGPFKQSYSLRETGNFIPLSNHPTRHPGELKEIPNISGGRSGELFGSTLFDPLDVCTEHQEFLVDVLIATVDVIEAGNFRATLSIQRGED